MLKKILIGLMAVVVAVIIILEIAVYVIQGPEQEQGETDLRFTDIKTSFTHKIDPVKSLPFMGIAAIDVDGNAVDEIFVGGGNTQSDEFFKYKDGALVSMGGDLGVTKTEGTATFGAAVIDATGDGKNDIFVAREDGVYFYTNTGGAFEGGKVDFPLDKKSQPLSIALADLNHDGAVDMYVSNYIGNEYVEGQTIFTRPYGAYSNLLLNNGDNTFTDITKSSGLFQQHNTFTSVFVDLDNDMDSDLVIAHDTGRVRIYRNNGDLTFTEMPNPTVFSYPMGIAVSDMNNDGFMDLYFSNVGTTLPDALVRGDLKDDQPFNPNYMLLENQGDFTFKDAVSEKNAAKYGFGWGLISYDFNNDSMQDYLVAQNYARFPGVEWLELYSGSLLQQYADGSFKPVEETAHAENKNFGISPIATDFNQDGWPDIAISNLNGPLKAFLNEGGSNNWLKVRLPNVPKSIGAMVVLTTDSGKIFRNQFYTSEGLSSDPSHELYFGLGTETKITSVKIMLQTGESKSYEAPEANQTLKVDFPLN